MEVQLKKVTNGFNIVASGKDFYSCRSKSFLTDKEINQLCTKCKVEYMGKRVLVQKRYAIHLAKYKGRIYELKTVVRETNRIKIHFCNFIGELKDLESLNEYKYCVQRTSKERYCSWYYKQNEWMKAQEKQQELNKKGYDTLLIEV